MDYARHFDHSSRKPKWKSDLCLKIGQPEIRSNLSRRQAFPGEGIRDIHFGPCYDLIRQDC